MKKVLFIIMVFVFFTLINIQKVNADDITYVSCNYSNGEEKIRLDFLSTDKTKIYINGKLTDIDYYFNNDVSKSSDCPKSIIYIKSFEGVNIQEFYQITKMGFSPRLVELGRKSVYLDESFSQKYPQIKIIYSQYDLFVEEEKSNIDPNKLTNYDNYTGNTVSCGNGLLKNLPSSIPRVVSMIYIAIQILVPVVLVIVSSIDLVKSVAAQKEDEITKGRQILVKRLVAAALVFMVFMIVKLIISVAADNSKGILDCANCFISNNCS